MDNMKKCITADGERNYGLWMKKDEKTAIRKCKCCGIDFELPITDNISNQIDKQNEAIHLLKSFLLLPIDDPDIISYFNVILVDVVDFIEDEKKMLLVDKLNKLKASIYISDENRKIIEYFINSIINNDNDLFFDTMEVFEAHNSFELSSNIGYSR